MKLIPLTQGYFTKVDDDDFARLASYRWQPSKIRQHIRVCRIVKIDGKRTTLYMARDVINAPRGKYVDHINGDNLDNRKCNLRICTNSENLRNRSKNKTNTSGYKGVYKNKDTYTKVNKNKPWKVLIMTKGNSKFIGTFKTKKEAAKAYNKAAKKYHGNFAYFNKIV